jgi:predicted metal-binding membrane protein
VSSALRGRLATGGLIASVRRLGFREPEWTVLLAAAAGWVVLAAVLWVPASETSGMGMTGDSHSGMHDTQLSNPAMSYVVMSAQTALVWIVMVAAMMLPTTVPAIRYVAFASRRSRRQRPVLAFSLGYLAAWLTLGVLVVALHPVLHPAVPTVAAVIVMLAAVWELTPVKRRALRQCHRTYPVRFSGGPADLSAAHFGWKHGLACLRIGGPAMVALLAVDHPLVPTLVVTVIMFSQKIFVRPERWRVPVAVGGILAGVLILVLGRYS